ncbi:MAG: CPBP family glutamic-type intramembrane protease [Pseudomonadota bacterium]
MSNAWRAKVVDARTRCRVELALLAFFTPLYIAFGPRGMLIHMALAGLLLGYILADARYTRAFVWVAPGGSVRERWRGSLVTLIPLTLTTLVAFVALGVTQGAQLDPIAITSRLLVYMAWALVQQTLFQFYLLGRLLRAAPGLPPAVLIALSGLSYGLVHLPDLQLTVLTCIAGVIWTADYYRHRLLLTVAASHALLGTAYYAFIGIY